MAIVYPNATETINRKPYRVLVPRRYQPNLPQDFLSGRVQPFYQPEYIDEPQLAPYTISHMIDMVDKEVVFTILDDEDLCDIFETVDFYLGNIRADIERGDKAMIAFARKVIKFREMLYPMLFRILNLRPEFKKRFYPSGRTTNTFYSMLRDVGRGDITQDGVDLNDPLYLLRFPPYDLEKIAPVAIDTDVPEEGTARPSSGRDMSVGIANTKIGERDDTAIVDDFMR